MLAAAASAAAASAAAISQGIFAHGCHVGKDPMSGRMHVLVVAWRFGGRTRALAFADGMQCAWAHRQSTARRRGFADAMQYAWLCRLLLRGQ